MISEAQFRGGSKHVTTALASSNVFHRGSPRVVVIESSSTGTTIPLWSATRVDEVGRPQYILINKSGRTLQLTGPGGTPNVGPTILNNQSAFIHLKNNTPGAAANVQWHVNVRAAGGVDHYVGTRSDPTTFPETFPREYPDPACLENCEDFLDLDPSGIVVPMFVDCVAYAANSAREPVRGADIHMPKEVGVEFLRGYFFEDQNHPNYTTLCQEMKDALFGDEDSKNPGKWHILTYQGTSFGTSRHWHHACWNGSFAFDDFAWGFPDTVSTHKPYWGKTFTYTRKSDQRTFTIEIRLVIENTVGTINPGPTPAGSTNDPDAGAWGSLFNLYVFCDEASPTYVDGTNFMPYGWGANTTFTKNDPAVWGGVLDLDDKKACHPQMVICASIPTSMESPKGFIWHPRSELRTTYCNRRSAGIPWTNPSIAAILGEHQWGNGVFGTLVDPVKQRAMTLGGDVPYSTPMDWVIIENKGTAGFGSGISFFYCTKTGWDATEGVLDLVGGTAIRLCILPQKEDQNPINTCEGHPDEPFETIGGTHRCLRNGDQTCCFGISRISDDGQTTGVATASLTAVQACIKTTYDYGPYPGFGFECGPPLKTRCETLATYTTNFNLPVSNYSLAMDGASSARSIKYAEWYPDPTTTKYPYRTYDSADVGGFIQRIGTVTFNLTGWTIATTGGGTYSNALAYRPTSSQLIDTEVKCTIPLSNSYQAGMGFRCGFSMGSLDSGYTVIFDRAANTVTVFRVSGGTETQIAQRTSAGISGSGSVEVRVLVYGSSIRVFWNTTSLLVNDCTFNSTSGDVLFVTKGSSTGAAFTPVFVFIEDNTESLLEVSAEWNSGSCIVGSAPLELLSGTGKCTEESANFSLCGGPPECDCTSWQRTRFDPAYPTAGTACSRLTDLSSGGRPLGVINQCDERNPLDCVGGEDAAMCNQCPSPYAMSRIVLPSCRISNLPVGGVDTSVSDSCLIVERWSYSPVVCA